MGYSFTFHAIDIAFYNAWLEYKNNLKYFNKKGHFRLTTF